MVLVSTDSMSALRPRFNSDRRHLETFSFVVSNFEAVLSYKCEPGSFSANRTWPKLPRKAMFMRIRPRNHSFPVVHRGTRVVVTVTPTTSSQAPCRQMRVRGTVLVLIVPDHLAQCSKLRYNGRNRESSDSSCP